MYQVAITLNGKDRKGNKYSKSLDVSNWYKTEKRGGYLEIDASEENPIEITEVNISAINSKNETESATEPIFNSTLKTNFAILLNGINSNEFCDLPSLNNAYSNESISAKHFAIVIGLNTTKKEPSEIEKAMTNGRGKINGTYIWTEGHDKRSVRLVTPTTDQNGNWIFKDSMPIGKEMPLLISFQVEYISACNDTIKYYSAYKQKLNDRKAWDYKISMSPVAIDNPIFQGTNDGSQNVLALRLIGTGSSISISGGSVIFSDNAKITMSSSEFYNKPESKTTPFYTVYFERTKQETSAIQYNTTWNKTLEQFEVTTSLNASKDNPLTIKSVSITVVNDKKDTIIYETNGEIATSMDGKDILMLINRTEKIKYHNPCKTKYRLKELTYSESVVSGVYGLQVSFQFENNSDLPAQVAMIVEIKDCNGTSQFINITLKYDDKTNTYHGFQALTQTRNCKLELVYGEIAAYNTCKDKTVWMFSANESKNNGKGTRVVATTTNGTPGLL